MNSACPECPVAAVEYVLHRLYVASIAVQRPNHTIKDETEHQMALRLAEKTLGLA